MVSKVIIDCDIVVYSVRWRDLEHSAKISVDRQSPFLPELALGRRWSFDLARIFDRSRRPEYSTFGNSDDQKQRQVQDLDGRNMDLVKPARAYDEFKRYE